MEVMEAGHGRRQELSQVSPWATGWYKHITKLSPVVLCGTWANLLRWLKIVNFEATSDRYLYLVFSGGLTGLENERNRR